MTRNCYGNTFVSFSFLRKFLFFLALCGSEIFYYDFFKSLKFRRRVKKCKNPEIYTLLQ